MTKLGGLPTHKNGYFEVHTKIIFRSTQQGSCYSRMKARMKAPQRIISILHIHEPEKGIGKEPKTIGIANATAYLYF